MKVNDKVYVKNWGNVYSNFYKWVDGERISIFDWKTKIPNYSDVTFFHERKWTPKLTLKGEPYKNGDTVLVSDIPAYKNYEYTLIECHTHPKGGEISTDFRTKGNPSAKVYYYPKYVWLAKSDNGCYIQITEEGLSTLTTEEQKKVANLESEKRLQALAKDNLGKWCMNDDLKLFPKELIKILYDKDQRTLFGSSMTKAIIKHRYIAKEYTINGNDLYMGWEQNFNGVGCDLIGKETIDWNGLKRRFIESKFAN